MTAGLSWLHKRGREKKKQKKNKIKETLKDAFDGISLVPRPSTASGFDRLQHAKTFLHTASDQKLELGNEARCYEVTKRE